MISAVKIAAKKSPRDTVLYVRVKDQNKMWVSATAKKLGFTSESEFVDLQLDELRAHYQVRNTATRARKKK